MKPYGYRHEPRNCRDVPDKGDIAFLGMSSRHLKQRAAKRQWAKRYWAKMERRSTKGLILAQAEIG